MYGRKLTSSSAAARHRSSWRRRRSSSSSVLFCHVRWTDDNRAAVSVGRSQLINPVDTDTHRQRRKDRQTHTSIPFHSPPLKHTYRYVSSNSARISSARFSIRRRNSRSLATRSRHPSPYVCVCVYTALQVVGVCEAEARNSIRLSINGGREGGFLSPCVMD